MAEAPPEAEDDADPDDAEQDPAALPLREATPAGAAGSPAPEPPPPAAPALVARGLTLRRRGPRGERAVLDAFDLELSRGVVGLYGPRRAGKSALLDLLLGLERRTAGELRVAGIDPGRQPLAARAAVGAVPQRIELYPFLDALALQGLAGDLYPRWQRKRFFALLARWGVPTRRRIEQLAPFGRARLALALALSHRPALLVLDEPADLDAAEHQALLDDALAERGEVPLLLLTAHPHRLEGRVDRLRDRLLVLSGGRLRFGGPPAALLETVRRLEVAPGAEPPELPPGVTALRWRPGGEERPGALWVQLGPEPGGLAAWGALGALPGVSAVAAPGLEEATLSLAAGPAEG